MPTYEYSCRDCGHLEEQFHSIKKDPVFLCPGCDTQLVRLISGGAGVIFKGVPGQSGFYALDYNRPREWADQDQEIAGAKRKVKDLRAQGKVRESWEGDTVTLKDAKNL